MFRSVISRSGNNSTIETVRRYLTIAFLATAITIFALSTLNAHASPGTTKPQPPTRSDNTGTDNPTCGPAWNVVSSPNQGAEPHRLTGVTAISANDVWAVGMYHLGGIWRTLIVHWNGSTWTIVPSPNLGTDSNHLHAVTAVSANDVWAVGSYVLPGAFLRTLIVHWDGISWTVVPSPHVGSDALQSISAVSANDIWAVGYSYLSNDGKTLVTHWDGTAWSLVPSPNVAGSRTHLSGVTAISANDVWASGFYRYEAVEQYDDTNQPLVLHWDGSIWSQVAIPFVSPDYAELTSVTTASPTDLWLAGFYYVGNTQKTLTMRRNGVTWSVVPSPNVGTYNNQLLSIDFTSSNDGWAVGYYNNGVDKTLVLHWNGSSWGIVGGSNLGLGNNQLISVAAFSAGDIWTVGNYENASAIQRTLIERHNPCVVILPTATPSATLNPSVTPVPSSTSQATPTSIPSATSASSATPATTPTSCPIQFIDVAQGSTFYTFVRCLACQTILSGYPDNTFHPNDNITRGQISKIVSNAAGFSEPQTGQSFNDVAIGSTFHLYIERLATRGIIGGYNCGGAAEPCVGPGYRPYFRPAGNTTRGQLSKIVCRAYACSGTPTGQHFEDVPTNHTFYTEISQLSALGSISGYVCGGPGEQCGTENKPYFRPAANVSRGQTAKIVSNTFFPECNTP